MVSAERLRLDEADTGGVPWGDNGAGIGASHQTGWTGTAGLLPLLFRGVSGEGLRTRGRGAIKSAAASQQMGAAR